MSSGQNGHTLEEAERYQRVFVKPMVDAVSTEVKAFCEKLASQVQGIDTKQNALQTDVNKLKENQRKALIGWGAIAAGISVGVTAGWNYLKSVISIKT